MAKLLSTEETQQHMTEVIQNDIPHGELQRALGVDAETMTAGFDGRWRMTAAQFRALRALMREHKIEGW